MGVFLFRKNAVLLCLKGEKDWNFFRPADRNGAFNNPVKRKRCFMRNIIFSVLLLTLAIAFTGCSGCCAQDVKKNHKKQAAAPHAILIIDDVAYLDGCDDCDCIEEDICVCPAKADCACCRKNLKKVPKEMQEKCKEMKKAHAKTAADCQECKKGNNDTACSDTKGDPKNGK